MSGMGEVAAVYADLKFANRMGGGAIRRMLNRKLSMAWEKWQFTAAEMARQQFMMQGAINRMLKREDVSWHGRSGSKCMLI